MLPGHLVTKRKQIETEYESDNEKDNEDDKEDALEDEKIFLGILQLDKKRV